jgi:hypothetical protein
MALNFDALNRYGRREYKFVQTASMRQVTAHFGNMDGGVCLGITMSWIREKLTTSNSLLRADAPLRNSAIKQFSSPVNSLKRISQGISPPKNSVMEKVLNKGKNGVRNENAMWIGALNQSVYQATNTGYLSQYLGLRQSFSYHPQPKVIKLPNNHPKRVFNETIADAASGLPRGAAMLIELEKDGPGHAIAFYKSRGNTLHFFDSNAGVYTISQRPTSNVLGFIEAWVQVYQVQAFWTFKTRKSNWFQIFDRADSSEVE